MPAWENQPIPDNVARTWPTVRSWTWLSPLRLRGEHPHVPGAAELVVVDEARTHAMGQAVGPGADAERVSEVYAQLRVSLMRDIGHRTACLDGTPVRADHDRTRCRWCGVPAVDHETPGDPGDPPPYQATHVAMPGQKPITGAEFEAAFYVELEALKYRRPHD
ncbi:hypothetical protein [Saccharopolyspora shandongensis]|uniref:hypothetical protein n=1 Tax=Saccharopolyspora shandongensis TaxID=418495 RepID=UPI0033F85A1E